MMIDFCKLWTASGFSEGMWHWFVPFRVFWSWHYHTISFSTLSYSTFHPDKNRKIMDLMKIFHFNLITWERTEIRWSDHWKCLCMNHLDISLWVIRFWFISSTPGSSNIWTFTKCPRFSIFSGVYPFSLLDTLSFFNTFRNELKDQFSGCRSAATSTSLQQRFSSFVLFFALDIVSSNKHWCEDTYICWDGFKQFVSIRWSCQVNGEWNRFMVRSQSPTTAFLFLNWTALLVGLGRRDCWSKAQTLYGYIRYILLPKIWSHLENPQLHICWQDLIAMARQRFDRKLLNVSSKILKIHSGNRIFALTPLNVHLSFHPSHFIETPCPSTVLMPIQDYSSGTKFEFLVLSLHLCLVIATRLWWGQEQPDRPGALNLS